MATRSPFVTPSSLSALAALLTSRWRSRKVRVRVSPGSPIQWYATFSPRPFSTWRSTQFQATFSSPPVNHFANGRSHSSVVLNGVDQSRVSRARLAQNASKSASASAYRSAVALAWAAKAGSGGKSRDSAIRFSISGGWRGCSALTVVSGLGGGGRGHRAAGRTRSDESVGIGREVALVGGKAGCQVAVVVPGQDDPLRARHLDAVLPERRQQPLAEIAGGRPLVCSTDGTEDLERDAVLGQRLDPLHARRLQHASLPGRIAGHLAADVVDDLDRLIDI